MINTKRLRLLIGWLGLLLPYIVALLLWKLPESISITYYRYESGPVFMIVLGAASLLLVSYKGYEWYDDIINTVTGIAGLGVCLFPCWNGAMINELIGTFQLPMQLSNVLHLISAFTFFALLSINSLFLFTKGDGQLTRNKKIRNIIYRVCGIGMLCSFLLLLLPYFYIKVWLVEAIALFFFGVSWLTKADAYPWLFADKK